MPLLAEKPEEDFDAVGEFKVESSNGGFSSPGFRRLLTWRLYGEKIPKGTHRHATPANPVFSSSGAPGLFFVRLRKAYHGHRAGPNC